MPQDPHLYGQRPHKKQKQDATLSSSLDFTAQLTSLMSNSSSGAGRSRSSKERKDDIFKVSKPKRSKDSDGSKKLQLKEVTGTEEETQELARARRRMEEKARLYAAMKRGDYVPKENEAAPLVDFDRKWADGVEEGKEDYSTSSDEDERDDSGDMVEFEDEFGRVRQVTKAEKDSLERRARRGLLGAEELERMSARPSAPGNLIYGDAVQSMAFNPEDADKMEELARKRDRSATPPPAQHYNADWEIRTKGTGFYKFSKDEETRAAEMEGLAEERRKTEDQRRVREEQKEARRRDIEKRREDMAARRAKKQADSFLDKLED
ncbi:hypothetical protein FZEAL_5284 [Fusarium zealandicum]|uniref:Uncharacterized protein n=1 Tax=Fusarium zealandicum TaxID=1053134 RepID=A0A8H4UK62_9HYPO|nr:hypothetical protein FZEAL_5284 [Fusarium zealandicum]